FRRATAREVEANGWNAGIYLVAGAPLVAGAASMRLLVPTSDDAARPLDLALAASGPGAPATLTRLGGDTETFVPEVFEYLPSLDDVEVGGALTMTLPGGSYGNLFVGGRDVHILGGGGGDGSFALDPIPIPGVGLPDVVSYLIEVDEVPGLGPEGCAGLDEPIVIRWASVRLAPAEFACAAAAAARRPQCSDGIDNDGDRWTDYARDPGCSSSADRSELDNPKSFPVGLYGEMKWCTRHASDWLAILVSTSAEIQGGFAANGGTRAAPYLAQTHCWVAPTLLDAYACDAAGGCEDAQGHDYPYNACNFSADCYMYQSIDDATHARRHSPGLPRLSNVQVIHDGTMDGNFLSFRGLCGQADPGGPRGVAIGRPYLDLPVVGCKDFVSTHELGHNFGASHDNSLQGGCGTVMAESWAVNCRWDFFSDLNRREINACVRDACLTPLW
ncbi:MAG TPA: hypothetical protein VHH36_08715, partial [Candidatus Thermoplasmatota archaeon]|nr:hypothetical protein [Candidatus Thermoplasmatota archaeon]